MKAGSIPALFTAARITTAPSSVAETWESEPPKLPMAVRTALTITGVRSLRIRSTPCAEFADLSQFYSFLERIFGLPPYDTLLCINVQVFVPLGWSSL
jgi:hypothetical protein